MSATSPTRPSLGPATASPVHTLVVAFNDVLDRCTQTRGANIDELMALFGEDAEWLIAGGVHLRGKPAIRAAYLNRAERLEQVCEIQGIDVWGDMAVCRLLRRDSTFQRQGMTRNLRIMLIKGGTIQRITVVVDRDEQELFHMPDPLSSNGSGGYGHAA